MKLIRVLKQYFRERKFQNDTRKLRHCGFEFAVCPKTSAKSHRVHRVGCHNLMPKRSVVRPIYFRRYDDIILNKQIEDKPLLYCQACFPEFIGYSANSEERVNGHTKG